MTDFVNDALLPEGVRDELPPTAAKEAHLVLALEQSFEGFGYQRVKPPMIEFEETLFSGGSASLKAKSFRVMDPLTQRMMAVRSDMTPQIARIARTRLSKQPRPLRLCYTGQVLRVKGDSLRPERQFTQAGLELIGASELLADLEVLTAAIEALRRAGLSGLTVDLTSPNLVPALCAAYNLPEDQVTVARQVADGKDVSLLPQAWPEGLRRQLSTLIGCTGPFDVALAALEAMDLPDEAVEIRDSLKALGVEFQALNPDVGLTLDPGEYHGFEYQTGLGFTIFASGVRGELGRGGRYMIHDDATRGETAVGMSLYLDTILRGIPDAAPAQRVLIRPADGLVAHRKLREDGYCVVWALTDEDMTVQAQNLKCDFVWQDDRLSAIAT